MKPALLFLLPLIAAAQSPFKIPYECTPADVDAFGLNCSTEDPCPVFLELSAADSAGNRILLTGNLHTSDRTLFAVLLTSEDRGVTWTDGYERMRSAALEQIQFADLQNGWISGESLDPLARDPFLLITTDGGKVWRKKVIVEDAKYGTIAQFSFDSAMSGQLVIDASQGKAIHQELYETNTGGESWELKQTGNKAIRLKPRPAAALNWRVRADAASGTYRLERGGGQAWEPVANFVIHIADCQ